MPMTNHLAVLVMNDYFWVPTNYLALHSTDPTAAGLSSGEVVGGSYERQQLFWDLPSTRTITNSSSIVFHNLPDCTVSYLGIWTTRTGGFCYYTLHFTPAEVISAGDTFTIPVNDLSIEFS